MNCGELEQVLGALLARETDETERVELLERARGHARRCAACRGAMDLIELSGLPPEERDLAEAAPEGYWEGFNERVRQRVAGEARRRSGRPAWTSLGAAAAVLLMVLVGWALLGRRTGTEPAGVAQSPGAVAPRDEVPMLPTDDVDGLDELDALLVGLGGGDGPLAGESGDGWVFPETDELDPEARRRLLEWLDEQAVDDGGLT